MGQRGCDVGRAESVATVHPRLEHFRSSAAEPVRETVRRARAAEREADQRVRCQTVVEARGAAIDARGVIVRADRCHFRRSIACRRSPPPTRSSAARRQLRAAAPCAPSPHTHRAPPGCGLCASPRRPAFVLIRVARCAALRCAAHAAFADERIRHHVEEAVHRVEGRLLRAGRGFARQLRQCPGGVSRAELPKPVGRVPPAALNRVDQRVATVCLVAGSDRHAEFECRHVQVEDRRCSYRSSAIAMKFAGRLVLTSALNVPLTPPVALRIV